MTKYVITRNSDFTEWGMTETLGGRQDLYRSADGTMMRAVLLFQAPTWEQAHEVFKWVRKNLKERLTQLRNQSKTWEEVTDLLKGQTTN